MALQIATGGTAAKFALVLLDVGRFGQVNETLGRRGGDELLVRISKRLGSVMRPQDTLARIHGNTFAVLIAAVDDESDVALFVEERIQADYAIAVERHRRLVIDMVGWSRGAVIVGTVGLDPKI